MKSRSTAKLHIKTLRGDFFFYVCLFLFSPPDRLIFLLPVGRLLVVVSLHSTTLQSTLSWALNPTTFMPVAVVSPVTSKALSVSLTGLKANKFCMFNKSTFCVKCLAVLAASICRAAYGDRNFACTKMLKRQDCHQFEQRTLLFQYRCPLLTPAFSQGSSGHRSLSTLKIIYYVRRTEFSLCVSLTPFPYLSFLAVKTNAVSSASWQDLLSSLLE